MSDQDLLDLVYGSSGGFTPSPGSSLLDQVYGATDFTDLPAPSEERNVQGFWREVLGAGASAAAGLGLTAHRLGSHLQPDWFGAGEREKKYSEMWRRWQARTAPADQRGFRERLADDPLRAITRAGVAAVPSLAPMAVGALAGPGGLAAGAAVGAGLGGGSMGLDVYDEAKRRGASDGRALSLGVGVGTLGALLDGLGAKGLAKPVSTGLMGAAVDAVRQGTTKKLAKQILAGTAGEVATEEAQEMLSMIGEYAAGTPLDELLESAPDRLAEAAVGAALVSGGIGTASAVGQAGQQRRYQRQQIHLSGEAARRQSELFGATLKQIDGLDADAKASLVADAAAFSDFYRARVASYTRELGEFESLTIPDEDLARIDRFVDNAKQLGTVAHQKARHVGAETLWIDKAKQLYGKKSKAVRGLEIAFSLGRVGRVKAQAVSHNPIVNLRGQVVARSITDILAPVYAAKPDLSADPEPDFLKRFASELQWEGAQKLWKDSPLARHLEETRWVLRQEELAERAAADPDALVKPAAKITAEARERHEYLKTLPEYDLLKKTAEELSSWDQHVITLGEATGVLSRDAAEHILGMGKHYAGFYEARDEGGELKVKFANPNAFDPQEFFQPVTRGLRADQKLALPTVASLQRAQALHTLAGYQHGRQNVVRMVNAVPDAFASEGIVVDHHLEPDEAKAQGLVETEIVLGGQKRKIFAPPDLAAATRDGQDLELQTFKVYVDGEQQTLYAPAPFAEALDAMPAPTRHAMRKLFAFFTSMRRSTSILTPRFTATAFFRDQPEAAAIAATHDVTYRPWVDAMQAFGQLAQEFIGPGNAQARGFLAQGGGLASIASTEMAESLGSLQDVALRVRQDHAPNTIEAMKYMLRRAGRAYAGEINAARQGDWAHMGSALLSPIAHLTEVIDKSTRLGLYNASLRNGKTIQEALDVSRRGAIDFSRKGKDSQLLGDFYPFYNPQVQSFDLNTEAATRGGLGVAASVAGLVVFPELVHFMFRHDDEEYQARPEWEKKRNYFWWKTDDGEWLTTPRPLGWLSAVFGYALGQTLEQSYRDDPRVVGRVLGALQDEIPLVSQFSMVGFDDEGAPASRVMESLPEAAVLPFELGMNHKAFFNTPIVPAWLDTKHPKERAYRNTPEVYRDIAKLLPEKVTPLHVEHVARSAAGSLGAGMLRFQDAVTREGDFELDELPVVTAFVSRRRDAPSLAPVQRLFELVREQKYYRGYTPTTPEEGLRVADYQRMAGALKQIRGLIEQRNALDQIGDFDARNNLDEIIIQLATDTLRGTGERGSPGEGFAPALGEGAQEARRILGHVFGGGQ